ncbi:hypothetical protein EV191_101231 [Tamaricihabitans halophyticus]|uniref:Uncharacterized protein n=1 Tax=Tamaricihabitans halophyticus TaxID=1262583 RepID=A0A4R2R0W3_9PSEU|nr:hypothetical protein [Tamaricihabitans halophyticus]TCP56290.1 hypothetical protein EV191_101231 [Tamaricihabitans halophyticus]
MTRTLRRFGRYVVRIKRDLDYGHDVMRGYVEPGTRARARKRR